MEQNLTRIFTLFGGLALFLYGMDALSHSLETAAGSRLKKPAGRCDRQPGAGRAGGGCGHGGAAKQLGSHGDGAGLCKCGPADPAAGGPGDLWLQHRNHRYRTAAGFPAGRCARPCAAGRAAALLCLCRGGRARAVGRAVFAFGLLFEGIADMGTAMEPLAQSPVFVHWLGRVRQHSWLGLLAGLGMTLTVQSSSATIALLQNFAARPGLDGSSLLGLAGALPVLLGDNIGTTITAVLASLSASRDAKRVAAAHAVFNLTGAAVFCAGLPLYVRLTAALSPKGPELAVIARQIANAHTLFNVMCTLVWLPLTPLMVRFVCRLVPDRAVR